MELTNREIKLIKSLSESKVRRVESIFKAEGTKCVCDTLDYFSLRYLFATAAWAENHPEVIAKAGNRFVQFPNREMSRLSSLQTPPQVIAVYDLPHDETPDLASGLTLALDSIQDPGNLGTIIRTCDWFGVRRIICSRETADPYGPKVVQSTMGAISRVKVIACDLLDTISAYRNEVGTDAHVYGTFLDGSEIYSQPLNPSGIIVMGNEGKGISREIERLVSDRLFIPPYPSGVSTSESLNVGIATGIVLSQFRSR